MTGTPVRIVSALLVTLPLALATSERSARAQGYPPPAAPPGYPVSAPSPAGALPPGTPQEGGTRSDDSEDSGLGLEWVWLNAEVGGAFVNMTSFSTSSLGLQNTSSGGPAFGVGAGVRLLFFTLGVRARDLELSSIGSLWLLNLEAAFHTRIWRLDPYFGVRGGYDFVGSLSSSTLPVAAGSTPPDVSVHGFNVGPIAGLDLYLTKLISVGGDVDWQFLFLQRPKPALPAGVSVGTLPAQEQTLYNESGSSAGFGLTISAHLGLHF